MTDFSALWAEHRNYVFRLILSSVRHASDADDLMQVVAIEAYKSFPSLRDPDKFRPFGFGASPFVSSSVTTNASTPSRKNCWTPQNWKNGFPAINRILLPRPIPVCWFGISLQLCPANGRTPWRCTCTSTFPSGTSTRCWAENIPRLTPTSAGYAVNWKYSVLRRR